MKTTELTSAPTRQPAAAASHLALGLWMRGSIAGAALALAGIASLFSQPPTLSALLALTWVAAGGTFSWLCWQRASAHLEGIESNESRHAAMAPAEAGLSLTGQRA
jgi:hypothetical protein